MKCVAVWCSLLQSRDVHAFLYQRSVAVCCSVLQRVGVWLSVLGVCCGVLR